MRRNELLNQLGEIIGVADIMFAETAANSHSPNQLNGSITVNLGFAESGEMQSSHAEMWGTPGIISVPALPDKTSNNLDAAQALYFNHGGQAIVFATRDTRTQSLAGNINPGETCCYAPSGQARALFKANGSVTLMTTSDNTPTGDAVTLSISPTGFYFKSPFGKITFDATGFHVVTSTGARIDMGGLSAPAPLDTLVGSYARVSAGMVNLDTSITNIGPSSGVFLPAIIATQPVAVPMTPILAPGFVLAGVGSTKMFVGV